MSETCQSVWSHLMRLSFEQKWVDVNGVRRRYARAGSPDNPTVLMVHGIGGSWEAFCANIGPFAQHFDVIALDNIGAGFTDKPERPAYEMKDYVARLKGFLDALGVAKTSLVGVSMGGWSAINFTHAYPAMVDRLALCAASSLKRDPGVTPPAASDIRNDRQKAIDEPSWGNIASLFVDLIHDPEKRLADFVKIRQTVYQLPEMKASMQRILAITATEVFNRSALSDEEWRSIDKPVLLIESADDSEHFRKNTARAQSLSPNVRTFSMRKVAHWPQFEDHHTFNAQALAFLRGA